MERTWSNIQEIWYFVFGSVQNDTVEPPQKGEISPEIHQIAQQSYENKQITQRVNMNTLKQERTVDGTRNLEKFVCCCREKRNDRTGERGGNTAKSIVGRMRSWRRMRQQQQQIRSRWMYEWGRGKSKKGGEQKPGTTWMENCRRQVEMKWAVNYGRRRWHNQNKQCRRGK